MSRIFFDPFQPKLYDIEFESGKVHWKYFYGDIKEDIPPGMPYH